MSISSTLDPLVLDPPTLPSSYQIIYPEVATYQVFSTVITNNLYAYPNEFGINQALSIGGSSNVEIEANHQLAVYVKDSGDVRFFATTHSGQTRTDKEILHIAASSSTTTTVSAMSGNFLELSGADTSNTVSISGTKMTYDGSAYQKFDTTASLGFNFMNPLNIDQYLTVNQGAYISGNMIVGSNLVVQGHFFSHDMHLVVDRTNSSMPTDLARIGYGFQVNDRNQLELVKFTKFFDNTEVQKRVAVFGNTNINYTDTSDTLDQYLVFDEIAGVNMYENGNIIVPGGSSGSSYWNYMAGTTDIYYDAGSTNVTTLTASNISSPNILTTSDRRLKDIIGELASTQCLDVVNSLDVYEFTFKDDPIKRIRHGFIAQQVQEVIPNAVEEHEHLSIDTTSILANVVGAIKELYALLKPTA